MSPLDHLLFSLGANLAVLLSVALLGRAPPRLVVNVCLAGMLMVLMPWPLVAPLVSAATTAVFDWRAVGAPVNVLRDIVLPSDPARAGGWPWSEILLVAWLLIAADHYVVHVVTVVERLLWWNPLVWVLGRIARQHLEYACDERCKSYLGERPYRIALAEMAIDRMPMPSLPGALGLGLERRTPRHHCRGVDGRSTWQPEWPPLVRP